MFKKLAVGALSIGIMFAGAGNTYAAESNNLNKNIKDPSTFYIKPVAQSIANTTAYLSGNTLTLGIIGLGNPFTPTNYQQVAWTGDGSEPGNNNVLAYVDAKAGNGKDVSKDVAWSTVESKIKTDYIYGWAKSKSGTWYGAGKTPKPSK